MLELEKFTSIILHRIIVASTLAVELGKFTIVCLERELLHPHRLELPRNLLQVLGKNPRIQVLDNDKVRQQGSTDMRNGAGLPPKEDTIRTSRWWFSS